MVPEHSLKLEKSQGPRHTNKVEQYKKRCRPLRSVCLLSQENEDFLYLVNLGMKKKNRR